MDLRLRIVDETKILSRILNGYYPIKVGKYNLRVCLPSIDIENRASLFYNELLEDLRFDDKDAWLDEQKRMFILNVQNIWSSDKEKELDILLKDVEKLKENLYKHYALTDTRKLIKEKLEEINTEISTLHYQRYTYYEHTKESYATIMKNRHIIKNTVYYKKQLFFKYNKKNELYYLQKISNLTKDLTIQDVRKIVHNSSWKSLWESAKAEVFNKPIIKCNTEQRMLISASQLIDNVRQHPNCPSDDILRDSDALDGWILHENREFEKKQKTKDIESTLQNKEAGEVFVMASSPEEIKDIMSLNDPLTRSQINRMNTFVKDQDSNKVEWSDIPAMKEAILQEHKKNE